MISTTTTSPPGKIDPCIEKSRECTFGAVCRVSMDGMTARCECPTSCETFGDSDQDQPVCGSNGRDYDNECQLNLEACQTFSDIKVAKIGKCDPCVGVMCPLGQSCYPGEFNTGVCQCTTECPTDLSPVCGTDNRVYDNECLLRYTACLQNNNSITVAYYGQCRDNPCSGVICELYATCQVSQDQTATCKCPESCPVERSEICGGNGKTYRNLCALQRDSCENQVNITIAGPQACAENDCLNYDCPHNGECQLIKANLDLPPVPTCVCPICSALIKPVCGEDGITYENECSLKRNNCLKERDVKVSHVGSCSKCDGIKCEFGGVCRNRNGTSVCLCPDDCVDSHLPVCAENDVTFNNMCELTIESCKQQKEIKKVSDGACDGNQCEREAECLYGGLCVGNACLCDWTCSDDEVSICGTDNQTYYSECDLRKSSCEKQTDITVAYQGQCSNRQSGADGGEGQGGAGGGVPGEGQGSLLETTTYMSNICNTDTNCRYEGQCDYTEGRPGVCVCEGFFDFCKTAEDTPSCGSDGVLYKNICELRETQCNTQREISLRPTDFCQVDNTTPSIPPDTVMCFDDQSPLTDIWGDFINCTQCMPSQISQCDLCPSTGYCSNGVCCPKDPELPECVYTQFGCCRDNATLASPGPDHRGCPYTCQCHEFGSNGPLCNPITFQCDCKMGVVGPSCNKCKLGWYGLRNIQTDGNDGCLPCQCNELGSKRLDCEQNTGRCLCKDGVTGTKCDMCPEDGMILTSDGCVQPDDIPTDPEVQETCDTRDCGNGQCIMDADMEAVCTCDYSCSDDIDYICGSDGQTYPNICHLRRSACRDGGLMEVMRGECMPDTTLIDMTTPYIEPSTTTSSGIWNWWGGGARRFLADDPRHPATVEYSDLVAQSTCEDNPCANGATCRNDTRLGFTCLCTVFWTGAKCDQVNQFFVPSFSGESYIQLVGWDKPFTSFDLRLIVIPTDNTGVVLFAGKPSGRGDFMSLVLSQGYLEFRFDMGDGPLLLRTTDKLVTNRPYNIRAERTGGSAQLSVEGHDTVHRDAPGNKNSLDVEPILYVGHAQLNISEKMTKRLIRNLGGVSQGFVGCISMIHDADSNVNFVLGNSEDSLIFDGRDIGQCTSNPCLNSPCNNGGLCRMIDVFNYECDCINQFTGPTCAAKSKRARHVLSSMLSTKTNTTTSSDVFELPKLTGSSYIKYRLAHEVDYNLTVDIVFNTRHADGVLLYGSQYTDGSGDFILLSLEDQIPVLRLNLGSGVTLLRLDERVALRKWNLLTYSRLGKDSWLSLNENPARSIRSQGEMTYLNIQDHITVGAIPESVVHNRDYLHSPGLNGVIQRISFNGEDVSDLFKSAASLYEVKTYHGPPCHPNPCLDKHVCVPLLDGYKCQPK